MGITNTLNSELKLFTFYTLNSVFQTLNNVSMLQILKKIV
jgi:hypothetical protein